MNYLLVAAIFLASLVHAEASEFRTEVWTGKPIELRLPVGQEVAIILPEGDKTLGIPAHLDSSLDHLVIGHSIYLTAKEEFTPTRIVARGLDDESFYVVSLSASDSASGTSLRIITPKDIPEDFGKVAGRQRADVNKTLIRHAAQSLYAPDRLIPENPSIRPTPVSKKTLLLRSRLIGSIPDEATGVCIPTKDLVGQPIQAWRLGSHYVTAVRIQNISDREITVDPLGCHIQGAFLTFSAQHSTLAPRVVQECTPAADKVGKQQCIERRTHKDVTTFYFTSKVPFWDAIYHEH